ncbi:MAG: CBS domain-containing protein [Gammaproteobacteria bacterium]|nr:CBS domain-containing protein [Gammaproteobacteria bacterium]
MKRVNEVLEAKGHDVWSIGPDASVYDAIQIMADKKVGALMVIEGTKLVGVISETDYTRRVILKGRTSENTRVKEIMTSRVLYTQPEQDIEECMAIMTEKRTRHLPVMKETELLGVISIGDLVKAIIDEQRFTIEQLEHYITG